MIRSKEDNLAPAVDIMDTERHSAERMDYGMMVPGGLMPRRLPFYLAAPLPRVRGSLQGVSAEP
ncbi:hypothetical protein F7725_023893 [Dissostichus mawsoni]|uniref:Uncharacterized protein n=1 Tax=Dissostichus mawsoni TaxID=36200 RepID=A0A7J5XXV2_DISMA|nr:hypothetical protein F7725_023893 [Dissostichus mawsoni]